MAFVRNLHDLQRYEDRTALYGRMNHVEVSRAQRSLRESMLLQIRLERLLLSMTRRFETYR